MEEPEVPEDDVEQPVNMAGMVRSQSQMPTGFESMTYARQNMALGFNPYSEIGLSPNKQALANARSKAIAESYKPQKAPDPRSIDAQFYAGLGDFGSVEALMKSKGAAIFQLGEEFEFDDVEPDGKPTKKKFSIGPRGNYGFKGPDGKPINIPAYMMARKAGVGSVPFKGGDEAARNFRTSLQSLAKMNREMAQLEALYRKNTYLGTLDPSEDSAMARMLESSIKTDYLALMKNMKGMGGSVSDNDMLLAGTMVPQRASKAITRLGGNELSILRSVRESAFNKVLEVGGANGLMFIDSNPKPKINSYFQKGVIDTKPR